MKNKIVRLLLKTGLALIVVVIIIFHPLYRLGWNTPWYTAYKGPLVIMEEDGKTVKTPVATLAILSASLDYMLKDDDLRELALPVKAKMVEYTSLLADTYPTAEGVQVDFIAMLHPSIFTDDADYQAAIKESQDNVCTLLQNGTYDILGREGSWSTPLNVETLILENHYGLEKMGVPLNNETEKLVRTAVLKDLGFNGAMRYIHLNPEANAMGIEDRELFYLHEQVTILKFRGSLTKRGMYEYCDRMLVWLRTEIALAKLLRQMKEAGLKRGVFVMGQSHRHQFEVLSSQLGLNATIHHTVPERYRGDEAQ